MLDRFGGSRVGVSDAAKQEWCVPTLTLYSHAADGSIETWTTAIPADLSEDIAEYILGIAEPPRRLRSVDLTEESVAGPDGEAGHLTN